MTFLNSQTRFKTVELLPVLCVLSDGTENLVSLDGEGDPAVGGAVRDLGGGLGGAGAHQEVQPQLGLFDEHQPAAGVAVLHVVRHLGRGVETERGGGGEEGLQVNINQAAANILSV